jgi:hypothetical protein
MIYIYQIPHGCIACYEDMHLFWGNLFVERLPKPLMIANRYQKTKRIYCFLKKFYNHLY